MIVQAVLGRRQPEQRDRQRLCLAYLPGIEERGLFLKIFYTFLK